MLILGREQVDLSEFDVKPQGVDLHLTGLNLGSQEVKISDFLHLHRTMNLGQFIRVIQLPIDEGLRKLFLIALFS